MRELGGLSLSSRVVAPDAKPSSLQAKGLEAADSGAGTAEQLCSGDTHARPQVRADGTEVCVCPNTNNRRPKAAANAQKKLPAKAAGRQGAEKKGAGRGAAGKENGGTSGTQLVPHGSCPQDQEADAQAAPRESGVQWYCASVPGELRAARPAMLGGACLALQVQSARHFAALHTMPGVSLMQPHCLKHAVLTLMCLGLQP